MNSDYGVHCYHAVMCMQQLQPSVNGKTHTQTHTHTHTGNWRPPVPPGSRADLSALMQRSLQGRQGTMLVDEEEVRVCVSACMSVCMCLLVAIACRAVMLEDEEEVCVSV